MYDENDIAALRDKVASMESERLRVDSDIAVLRARLVEEQNISLVLRARVETMESTLRTVRSENARLHSRIQESEARDFNT
jgi:chromosome segregation ATPase